MPLDDGMPFEVPVEQWLTMGRKLFGDDWRLWIFECPVCGNRQSMEDFKKLGIEPQLVYQECIGRHLPRPARDFGTKPGGNGRNSPCDYAAYGLFQAFKGHMVIPDGGGKSIPVFPFASPVIGEPDAA